MKPGEGKAVLFALCLVAAIGSATLVYTKKEEKLEQQKAYEEYVNECENNCIKTFEPGTHKLVVPYKYDTHEGHNTVIETVPGYEVVDYIFEDDTVIVLLENNETVTVKPTMQEDGEMEYTNIGTPLEYELEETSKSLSLVG